MHWTEVAHHPQPYLWAMVGKRPPFHISTSWLTQSSEANCLREPRRGFTSQTEHPNSEQAKDYYLSWTSAACKTKQCNPMLMDLWCLREHGPHVSPSNIDDWFFAWLTCVSIYLFNLNFCKFLDRSAISQWIWETKKRKSNGIKWYAKMKWLKDWHKPGEIIYETVIQNVIKNKVTYIPKPLLKKV